MANDHPYPPGLDLEGRGSSSAPHLADYWQIISRRLWLVLLVFAVTTASAIWAVSKQRVLYQAQLSLQVSDPLQRSRALNPTARISGMEIFVDPIRSEIEVLRSGIVARVVVDSLGLRLAPATDDFRRSDLFDEAWVDPEAPAQSLELAYDEAGREVELRAPGEGVLARGVVGEVLDAGFVRFVPRPPPGEERVYPLRILSYPTAAAYVRDGLAAVPRESTNIIDVTYTGDDPILAPRILNQAASALRAYGALKVRKAAREEVRFIEHQLDSARVQLRNSLDAIRRFKESRTFTSLSTQEQGLVNEAQDLTRRIQQTVGTWAVLAELSRTVERSGVAELVLV